MVRADSVNLFDLAAESHRVVSQKLDELMRGRFSGQQFEFLVNAIEPSTADTGGDLCGGRSCQKGGGQNMLSTLTRMAPIGSKTLPGYIREWVGWRKKETYTKSTCYHPRM